MALIETRKCVRTAVVLAVLFVMAWPARALDISGYYSPRNHDRPLRARTSYIILHTTEGKEKGALSKLLANGEAHYLVGLNGHVYRIIERNRLAFHAGRSMWNGLTNLDKYSIGIEVVGYHNKDISAAQYKALKELLSMLQLIYKVPDDNVVTHSMVAYGEPNPWHKRPHRGRKRCGMQFAKPDVRKKLGLDRRQTFDPDVKSGRLTVGDLYLAKVLYGTEKEQEVAAAHFVDEKANVINKGRSAWDVAGDSYNSSKTMYIFPDGRKLKGNQIKDWGKIPAGTKVITL